ncbi:6-phosphogluconate dehydrogenase, decarboxylating-like [Culex pipiens pallens]|uniref:6-phosphogluconate dehydrogenase, decarboxylating-like n=1 Tax=Culex pipiens pallens TaxID=42434 RepID=UPI001952A63E|nr:6-phosphogluconate dehydrogenase, decarboxylating-like [Culex pipiens pallens]
MGWAVTLSRWYGIEHGDMQLICEAYHLMLELGMTQKEMAQQFDKWSKGVLDSFLIEITRDILNYKDDEEYNVSVPHARPQRPVLCQHRFYAQGFMLLREAANEYKWNLKYGGIVRKPTLFYLLLVVSQADCFLAHTYELLGKKGKFLHTNWIDNGGNVSVSTYLVHIRRVRCRWLIPLHSVEQKHRLH